MDEEGFLAMQEEYLRMKKEEVANAQKMRECDPSSTRGQTDKLSI